MRPRRLSWTLAAIMALSTITTSQAPTGHAVFEQALAKERVDGNLTEAIKLYERVVAEFASDRALAARALVQVGRCYEKLGREEAVRAYERLVRDFADQVDAVELARARLATLKRPVPGPTTPHRARVSQGGQQQSTAVAFPGRHEGRISQLRQRTELGRLRRRKPADDAAHRL